MSAGALASLALLLSGCVYLRLLAFKHQLAAFDRHFTVDTRDGVHIGCLEPVLLNEDFRWLGFTPASTERLGESERWHVRWVKQLPPGVADPIVRDVEIDLLFTEGKLTRLLIPERYSAIIPKTFFVGLLRGVGTAQVDKASRLALARIVPAGDSASAGHVKAPELSAVLGPPSRQSIDGPRTLMAYRYVPTPAVARNGIFDLTFTFDTVTGQLLFLQGRSPVGQIAFNFEPAPTPPATELPPAKKS